MDAQAHLHQQVLSIAEQLTRSMIAGNGGTISVPPAASEWLEVAARELCILPASQVPGFS